ncbi:hypothetical protein AVEN_20125-1 [Araneus ventricosus]|uniref:Uncharacterized protein n=1 Tax=Araneus ventricosus TaxID=182803 RepID=A0A4Y2MVT0_ARAVE|nr:hypothetical protein AVEN_20125-1 [Araneus ventricosus]
MFSVHSQNFTYGKDRPLSDVATSAACMGCHLLERKLLLTLLWLILICAERSRVPFVGHLAIIASTCVDIPSSVAVFGLRVLLTSEMEPALLNFMKVLLRCHGLSEVCELH